VAFITLTNRRGGVFWLNVDQVSGLLALPKRAGTRIRLVTGEHMDVPTPFEAVQQLVHASRAASSTSGSAPPARRPRA
jgi:hypothetical protein